MALVEKTRPATGQLEASLRQAGVTVFGPRKIRTRQRITIVSRTTSSGRTSLHLPTLPHVSAKPKIGRRMQNRSGTVREVPALVVGNSVAVPPVHCFVFHRYRIVARLARAKTSTFKQAPPTSTFRLGQLRAGRSASESAKRNGVHHPADSPNVRAYHKRRHPVHPPGAEPRLRGAGPGEFVLGARPGLAKAWPWPGRGDSSNVPDNSQSQRINQIVPTS